jgi:hypothetical protein
MSTPYDDEPVANGAVALATRIRELNDEFRRDPSLLGVRIGLDKLVVTRGVAARGNEFVDRAMRAVRDYADFDEDNDPYGEHDFGAFTLDDAELFWKIDYYDTEMKWHSPNPADPDVTRRVLTIMLAEEY